MSETGNPTLRSIGKRILLQFTQIAHILQAEWSEKGDLKHDSLLSSIDVQSETERFQLWAANIGLFAAGDRSFEYRVRDNPTIDNYARQLLNELLEDLVDVSSVLMGSPRQVTEHLLGDEDEEDEEDEEDQAEADGESDTDQTTAVKDGELEIAEGDEEGDSFEAVRTLFDDIVDIIDRLYRLAAKLRSATNRTPSSARSFYHDTCMDKDGVEVPLTRDERSQARIQSEDFHLRRIEEILRQAQRDRIGQPFTEGEHSELGPHVKSFVRRFASGNAYRQQQFIFWRQREWERRNAVYETTTSQERHANESAPKDIHSHKLTGHTQHAPVLSEVPSQTWKVAKDNNILTLDDAGSLAGKTEQTATPTVYQPGSTRVGWPPFPKQLVGKKEFICPYCFVTCPPSYRGKAHWRAHLIQDLQPYTCTAEVCHQGDSKPLNTWEEWIVHEQLYHRTTYSCPSHAEDTFLTRTAYIEHITCIHVDSRDALLTVESIDRQAQLSASPSEPCPLCLYASDNWPDMDKHLAFHLEILALLALPQATGLENDDEEMDSVRNERGDDDAMDLLDEDMAGSITSLFKAEEGMVDQDDHRFPSGHMLTLTALSTHQAEVGSHDNGDTSLHAAAASGSRQKVSVLVRHGEQGINSRNLVGQTPLHKAATAGAVEVVELLLQIGADEATVDEEGQTPLHVAQSAQVTRLLIMYGANLELRNHKGQTPLHSATAKGDYEMIQTLLLAGANKGATDHDGQTPVDIAKTIRDPRIIFQMTDSSPRPPENDEDWCLQACISLHNASLISRFDKKAMECCRKSAQAVKRATETWRVAPNDIPGLLKLTQYDIVILCGNSGAIRLSGAERSLDETLIQIANIATVVTGTGISLRFLYGNLVWDNQDYGDVKAIVSDGIFRSTGNMKLGTRLREGIIIPILLDENRRKPVITIIITDGEPKGEHRDAMQRAILEYKNNPNRDKMSFFLIVQVGYNMAAQAFMREIQRDEAIRDMVFCSAEKLDSLYGKASGATTPGDVDEKYTSILLSLFATAVADRSR